MLLVDCWLVVVVLTMELLIFGCMELLIFFVAGHLH